ncbi:MAG: FIST signal transduction protein [Dehalococcoidia bacterium]
MKVEVAVFRDGRWAPALPLKLDGPQTLVVAFGSLSLEAAGEPMEELSAAFPNSVVLGCSTAGEILDGDILDDAIVASIVRFDRTTLRPACAPVDVIEASAAAGEAVASALVRDDLRSVFVISDGLNVNGSELARGLNAVLPPGVIATGGLAADGDRFASTWIYSGGQMHQSRIAAVGLYGDAIRIGHGSRGGWDIFGPERLVTRSEGSVLFELDGQPALGLYRQYLGDLAANLPASALLFPLAVRLAASQPPVVRTILGIDEAKQSLRFAGDIPQGAVAQLMHANMDRLVDAAESAVGEATRLAGERGGLCIAISCVGRRLVLGERTVEETAAAFEALPSNVRQIGFYSYGELSPLASGSCDLHNQTMTITVMAEAA